MSALTTAVMDAGVLVISEAHAENTHSASFPACILHLSDIHISTNVEKYWAQFGDREGDLRLFISSIVPLLSPSAVIITGDLTDSKTAHGAGLQQLEEWKTYSSLLEALEAAGVPENTVFDVRGNHDVFNIASLRGQHLDLFAQHSATGRRGHGEHRVHTHVLLPRDTGSAGGGGKGSRIMSLEEWAIAATANSKPSGSDQKQIHLCPSAILLGIDASQSPTTKNPFNFMGRADAALTEEVKAQALAAAAATAPFCTDQNAPPLISYGHYPLSTIDHRAEQRPAWASVGILGALLHAKRSVHSVQGVAAILADRATAYISGHLHTLFGERLHRLHFAPSGEGHMAELESAAWKDDRRFRILIADSPAIAFIDLHFISPSVLHIGALRKRADTQSDAWHEAYSRRGWGVTAVDESSASVVDDVAMLTWPPDARYFPLATNVSHSIVQDEGGVRAVVFSLDMENNKEGALGQDNGDVSVELTGWLADGTQLFLHTIMEAEEGEEEGGGRFSNQNRNKDELQRIARPRTYVATPKVTVYCAEQGGSGGVKSASECLPPAQFIDLQVTVRGPENNSLSTSVRQPAALRCRGTGEGRQVCWAAPSEVPAPLSLTRLEWFTLLVNWPVFFHRMFWVIWALHLVLILIIPRYLAKKSDLPRHILASPLFRVPTITAAVATGGGANGADNNNSSGGPSLLAGRVEHLQGGFKLLMHSIVKAVLWPCAALVLCAGVNWVWLSMVVYSVYLVTGPLFLADVMTGHSPAIIFSYGMVGKFHGQGWEVIPTPDTLLVAFTHLIICIIPLTFWVACVVGRRVLIARRTGAGRSSWQVPDTFLGPISAPQAAAFLAILLVNYKIAYSKSLVMLGPISLIISPGLSWAVPSAVALVASTRDAGALAGWPPSPKAE